MCCDDRGSVATNHKFADFLFCLLYVQQCCGSCSGRGLLLLRLRDEARMTLHAYETLFRAGVTLGARQGGTGDRCQLVETAARLERDNAALRQVGRTQLSAPPAPGR